MARKGKKTTTGRYLPSTDREILRRIWTTPEDLFWFRMQLAEWHITYQGDYPEGVIKDLEFWNWFLRIVEINEKKIIKALIEQDQTRMRRAEWYHRVMYDLMKEYYMPDNLRRHKKTTSIANIKHETNEH